MRTTATLLLHATTTHTGRGWWRWRWCIHFWFHQYAWLWWEREREREDLLCWDSLLKNRERERERERERLCCIWERVVMLMILTSGDKVVFGRPPTKKVGKNVSHSPLLFCPEKQQQEEEEEEWDKGLDSFLSITHQLWCSLRAHYQSWLRAASLEGRSVVAALAFTCDYMQNHWKNKLEKVEMLKTVWSERGTPFFAGPWASSVRSWAGAGCALMGFSFSTGHGGRGLATKKWLVNVSVSLYYLFFAVDVLTWLHQRFVRGFHFSALLICGQLSLVLK